MSMIVGCLDRRFFARCSVLLVGATLLAGCGQQSQDSTEAGEKMSPRYKKLKDAQTKSGVSRPK